MDRVGLVSFLEFGLFFSFPFLVVLANVCFHPVCNFVLLFRDLGYEKLYSIQQIVPKVVASVY